MGVRHRPARLAHLVRLVLPVLLVLLVLLVRLVLLVLFVLLIVCSFFADVRRTQRRWEKRAGGRDAAHDSDSSDTSDGGEPLELEVRPARRRRFHANVQSRVMTLLGFELQRSQPLGGEDGDGDEHALLD